MTIASTESAAAAAASSVACPGYCVKLVSTSTCSRRAVSTAVIDGPVTCVEYGLTMRSARFTLARTSMPRTALIVVIPEAEPAVAALRLEHDWSAPLGVPAHITILFPFADGADIEEQAIADLLSPIPQFEFELDRVERFDGGAVWLHPEPSAPFAELTDAVWRRFPDYPPYE